MNPPSPKPERKMTSDCNPHKLCELADIRLKELDRRWEIKIQSIESAIIKAEHILSIRLEEMNNFRKQIAQERIEYMTRRESVLINLLISGLVVALGVFLTYLIIGPR